MKKSKILFLTLFFLIPYSLSAGTDNAWSTLVNNRGKISSYPKVVKELLKSDLYYVSIPYLKEYLTSVSRVKSRDVDQLIDRVVTQVGVRQFEVLPTDILKRTNAPVVKYILAKKYFRIGKYDKALKALDTRIPLKHSVKPFSLFLEASIYTIQKKHSSAIASYRECVGRTRSRMNKTSDKQKLRQLAINRDYCIAGIARAEFAAKSHDRANLSYLDLSKDSFIWPEILFEEAWNSFYQRDYNRTLGKLVTYKAPLLNFVFNPEVDVLRALTYMELCLWTDSEAVVNDFYKEYENSFLTVKKFFKSKGKDYKYYYLLAKSFSNGKKSGNKLLNKLLGSIVRDASYQEIQRSFQRGKDEIQKIRNLSNRKMRSVFSANLKESLLLQRDLIGAYVRKSLDIFLKQFEKAFEGMSFIKLEVLGREKSRLYDENIAEKRNRGDIKFLKRNEKQYFWTFNGEFWADELGDYVFSLKSECE